MVQTINVFVKAHGGELKIQTLPARSGSAGREGRRRPACRTGRHNIHNPVAYCLNLDRCDFYDEHDAMHIIVFNHVNHSIIQIMVQTIYDIVKALSSKIKVNSKDVKGLPDRRNGVHHSNYQ